MRACLVPIYLPGRWRVSDVGWWVLQAHYCLHLQPCCVQDKLSAITARYLEAPRGTSGSNSQQQQQLEAYIGECAQLLGLRSSSSSQGGGGGGGSSGSASGAGSAAAAREQLAEVLEAEVLCKTDAY